MSSTYEAIQLTPTLLESQPDILPSIARLHACCILIDGTLATFVPPLDVSTLIQWWTARWSECLAGQREIMIILDDHQPAKPSDPSSTTTTTPQNNAEASHRAAAETSDQNINALPSLVCGIVSLVTPVSQTGPHRGLVEKFFVSPTHRQLGLGRTLMSKLEHVALQRGRTNILLDTTVGTPAELVYPRLGYRRSGVIERNGYHPLTGKLVDEVFFWKDLNLDPLC